MPGARIAGHTNHRGRGIEVSGKPDITFVISGFRFQVSGVRCQKSEIEELRDSRIRELKKENLVYDFNS
jgi:hypothetical protein